MTKILHGSLDGIRTVPSNRKIMLIVKDGLGQEMPYSTHLPKSGYYSQFAFFVHMYIIVIVMVAISWSDHNSQWILWTVFFNRNRLLNVRGGVQLLCRDFTLYMMVTFPRKHFCSRIQISQYFQLQQNNWLLTC